MTKCPRCGYEENPLEGYSVPKTVVGQATNVTTSTVAVPKVSEYREKFKNHQLSPRDVMPPRPPPPQIVRQDGELDRFSYNGDSLFFGSGIEEDF